MASAGFVGLLLLWLSLADSLRFFERRLSFVSFYMPKAIFATVMLATTSMVNLLQAPGILAPVSSATGLPPAGSLPGPSSWGQHNFTADPMDRDFVASIRIVGDTWHAQALRLFTSPMQVPDLGSSGSGTTGGTLSSEIVIGMALVFGSLYAACLIGWIIWLAIALVLTNQVLERKPYAETRARQLLFRFYSYIMVVVVLFLIAVNCIQMGRFLI